MGPKIVHPNNSLGLWNIQTSSAICIEKGGRELITFVTDDMAQHCATKYLSRVSWVLEWPQTLIPSLYRWEYGGFWLQNDVANTWKQGDMKTGLIRNLQWGHMTEYGGLLKQLAIVTSFRTSSDHYFFKIPLVVSLRVSGSACLCHSHDFTAAWVLTM